MSAAPTVPECRIRWPVFAPGLMPDATMSGRAPNAPRHARYTAVAGGRSIASTGTSGSSAHWCSATGIGSDRCSGPIDAPAPLRSDARRDDEHVVAGLVQRPRRARRCPADSTPSSFVTSTRIGLSEPTPRAMPVRTPPRVFARRGSAGGSRSRRRGDRCVVVGGGVLGTMHAWAARERGHQVAQLEADLEARQASVRNFGLVWVSGRAAGPELAPRAASARALGAASAATVPGVGFRPDGSLTVAQHPAELAVLEAVAAAPEARRAPVPRCSSRPRCADGEPGGPGRAARRAALRRGTRSSSRVGCSRRCAAAMADRGGYTFVGGRGRDRSGAGPRAATTPARSGEADLAILCPGAAHTGVAAPWLGPWRRCGGAGSR